MKSHHFLLILILLLITSACDSEKKHKEKENKVKSSQNNKEPEMNLVNRERNSSKSHDESKEHQIDSTVFKTRLSQLDSLYGQAPFFFRNNDKTYYYISDEESTITAGALEQRNFKFGLATDSLDLILNVKYEKIGNPNDILNNSVEISKDGKYGIFNLSSFETLEPVFDFLLPSKTTEGKIAYGFKDGKWFKIEEESINKYYEIDFDPSEMISESIYVNPNNKSNLILSTKLYTTDNQEVFGGTGLYVLPSYINKLEVYDNEIVSNILNSQDKYAYFGIEDFRIKSSEEIESFSIGKNIKGFLVDLYEFGIDGRGYSLNQSKLIIQNKNSQDFQSIEVSSVHGGQMTFCSGYDIKLINDSLIQIKTNESRIAGSGFSEGTIYFYYKLSPQGKLIKLNSDRRFDFTKFVLIDETYFQGCYLNDASHEIESEYGYPLLQTEHLGISDLDLMRNEIFAEYGYKFKKLFWRKYFSEQSWYIPRYENVDSLLTETDKENINTILKMREKMMGREDDFTKPETVYYHAAG